MQSNTLSGYYCPTQVYMGIGAHSKVTDILRTLSARRVFVVVDAALLGTAFFQDFRDLLVKEGVHIAQFSEVEPDPSAHTVHRALEQATAHQASLVIAVGGGSSIDVAKAVAMLATNGGRIHDYEGIEKFTTPPLPLIAVPTTAGTGSEVSGSCVITDSDTGRKMSIRHAKLNPAAVAILDPLGLVTVPAHVAAHSGMDAFVHAFESYISLQANLITDAVNLQALGMISTHIRAFVSDRSDLDAGLKMLVGSCMAGMTFGQTGLGNVHCIARFIGADFHLSHGLSNALCLPHVARFNLPARPEKYADVARTMGHSIKGMPTNEAAEQAVIAIQALCHDLGIPSRLRDAGVDANRFDDIAEQCVQANYSRWNPRPTSAADFKAILTAAY